MTSDVASDRPDAILPDAACEMQRYRVHRLPVVDEKRRLLGIVSSMDLLSAMIEAAAQKV
ncbi:MAG: CBS domain-containing protein, partial [Planctomycetales bacterium]